MSAAFPHIAEDLSPQLSAAKTDSVTLHCSMSEAAWLVITSLHEGRTALRHYETQRAVGKSASEASADLWSHTAN
jgi:hypothetical protein